MKSDKRLTPFGITYHLVDLVHDEGEGSVREFWESIPPDTQLQVARILAAQLDPWRTSISELHAGFDAAMAPRVRGVL